MSFSDLLSSGRGPGVIGTLVALLVLGGFATLYIFVFDSDLQGGGIKIEAVIRDQANAIGSLKSENERHREEIEAAQPFTGHADEIAKLQRQLTTVTGEVADAAAAKEAAGQEVEAARKKFSDYRQSYRDSEWAAMAGEELGQLKTQDGKVYDKVKVRKVTATGLDVTTSTGPRSIDSALLPEALLDRLQFDKEQKDQAVAAETLVVDNHISDVNYAQKQKTYGDNVATINKLNGEIRAAQTQVRQDQEWLPRQDLNITQKRRDIDVEKTKKLSRAPKMMEELKGMQEAYDNVRRRIPETERKIRDSQANVDRLTAENAQLKRDIEKIVADFRARNASADKP